MQRQMKEGIAFGEAVQIVSPSSRSQINVKPESGFGGWADETIKPVREAAPHLDRKNSHPQHLTIALNRGVTGSVTNIIKNSIIRIFRLIFFDFSPLKADFLNRRLKSPYLI